VSRGLDDGLPGGALLAPLELLFGAAARLRGAGYDHGILPARRLPVQVISIGNLVAGGTGKTPLVIAVAQRLTAAGRRVAVLARGYGGTGERGINIIAPGAGAEADPRHFGDEAVMVARRLPALPVLTGADRVVLGQRAVEAYAADTLLLDDGFQHRRLWRDVDLAVLRAPRPFGNGHLLPRGPLREPITALARADLALVNVSDGPLDKALPAGLTRGRGSIEFEVRPSVVVDLKSGALSPLETLHGQRVLLVTGVARPTAVASTVTALGAEIVDVVAAADHHPWRSDELDELRRRAELSRASLLTTEKDAVKWSPPPPGAQALRVEARVITGAQLLWRQLLGSDLDTS